MVAETHYRIECGRGQIVPLQDHLRIVKRTHEEDLAKGYGAVYLPYALERKYPNANQEWMRM